MLRKTCKNCGIEKSVIEFHVTDRLIDGSNRYRSICKVCRNSKNRKNSVSVEVDGDNEEQVTIDMLASALIELSRFDLVRLDQISKYEFIAKTNSSEFLEKHSFDEIKKVAYNMMNDLGLFHPLEMKYGPGTYIVVGDSHGKHTKRPMFNLIKNVCDNIGVNGVIHVGHILDDDNDVSFCWKQIPNLTVIAGEEELNSIQKNINREQKCYEDGKVSEPYNFEIAREGVKLGKLTVLNQNLITDYTKTYIKNLDQQIFNESIVANSHRHELFTRNSYKDVYFVGSPGCICEPHIIKTIKQIDFIDGYQRKLAMPSGFKKYRRAKDMAKFWEQGLFVIHVDSEGDFSIVPCRIKEVDGKITTSYFDLIITEDSVEEPDTKVFLNSDIHCDMHDPDVLNIQDQIVDIYKPDVYYNLGDMQNNGAINHHEMSKGYHIDKSIVEENSTINYILKKTSKWAPKKFFIYGNHERFSKDFWRKYPQLKELIDSFLSNAIDEYGFKLIEHKDVSEIGNATFVHGDMRLYNQTGTALEKFAKTYKNNVVMGHVHYTSIRFGCYSLGLTGLLDQEYNEPNGSNWVHGFGTCNVYKGETFISNYSIVNYKTHLCGFIVTKDDEHDWDLPNYKFTINYEFDE